MPLSPWLIVIVYLPIYIGLLILWLRDRNNNTFLILSFIPLAVWLAYTWVGLFEPVIETRAVVVRYMLLFCAGVGYALLYDYYRRR